MSLTDEVGDTVYSPEVVVILLQIINNVHPLLARENLG